MSTDVDRWTHDAAGNMTKWEEVASGWTNRLVETYNARNQTTSIVATLPG
ncbi:MAG: hypothetical protein HY680_05120 [Chloroflexi bacterium]|nr:hypothetical protein [Chloroflexota bacterium]